MGMFQLLSNPIVRAGSELVIKISTSKFFLRTAFRLTSRPATVKIALLGAARRLCPYGAKL
jgi:hypothetical protein